MKPTSNKEGTAPKQDEESVPRNKYKTEKQLSFS